MKEQGEFKVEYSSLKAALARIKQELRKWYGVISVKELVTNRELAFEIEVLERMLASQGV